MQVKQCNSNKQCMTMYKPFPIGSAAKNNNKMNLTVCTLGGGILSSLFSFLNLLALNDPTKHLPCFFFYIFVCALTFCV